MTACASSPATSRAIAVGLGSLGTGAAIAAQSCSNQSDEACRDTAVAASVAVIGTALAAGAVAYLSETDGMPEAPTAPQTQPYSPVPPPTYDRVLLPSDMAVAGGTP